MSNRNSGIIKVYPLLACGIEWELRTDMCLKLSGLTLINNSLGKLDFNRFRLCSTETTWSVEGLLNIYYPLTGWFTIYSSVVTLPVRDINSYVLSSYAEVETYCNNLFDICKSGKFKGIIEVNPLSI
jgi:hypothetical protein